jgi:ribosome-binding factor A
MSSRRLLKAAEAIREVVSMAILAELRDPRIRNVTVTHVEVSPDMRHAKIHVSVMGSETEQNLSLRGLQSAAGFLQSKIAQQIDTRYTPRLMFVLDQGVKKSIEMARILKQVLPASSPESESSGKVSPDVEASAEDFDQYEAEDSHDADEVSGDDEGRRHSRRTGHPK